ncbi:unnamed protein product [Phytophthora fragariaefolia]|uniref:Unnamed protein product n=1 Tax=Phytophthora fragariaefolia TaxID=1490495 RepID=A0A9W7CKA0_9STRA|nr:unnamed protein product [Phytophthora fragariaefolia]
MSEHGTELDDEGVFGAKTEGTPYFQDSHMVDPRPSNRAARLARDTKSSNAQRGDARASSGRSCRRFVPREDSSDDDSGENDYYRKEDAEYDDLSDELARQVREVTEVKRLNSTPRLALATHRPLAQIKSFSGLRNRSENSMQWLRIFVYEMIGTRTPPNEWCMAFELVLRDGALHCFEDSSGEDVEDRSTDDDQSGRHHADPYHSDELDRHVAAANNSEHRTEAIGTYGRSENRGRPEDFPNRGLDRANHSVHYCYKRCKLCKQVHDAGKCEAFQTMSTYLRTKVDKKISQWSYSASLQRRLKLGSPSTETGLVPIGLPQLASPSVDADCVYAFVGERKWLKT